MTQRTFRLMSSYPVIIVYFTMLQSVTLGSIVHMQDNCSNHASYVDVDSVNVYPDLPFTASWTKQKHFWKSVEFDFESRYIKENSLNQPIVQTYILNYAHCDPGWVLSYDAYFYSKSKHILNNAVSKLTEYKNMTFGWSEISFLSKWWDEASSTQKVMLKQLVKEGRFEILTGGWVMPDEATTSLFGLINQLVEGHQWVQTHLHHNPITAWSIDPFGHSSTMPYILRKAGITGMMIQRIHYGWKHYFAENRSGQFRWFPRWSSDFKDSIICHNAPFDLYPTKHSCGPHDHICMMFDFRHVQGRREEHHSFMHPVSENNLHDLSTKLVGELRRTASLANHNFVFAQFGGDFRFEDPAEFDQQYHNLTLIFNHINSVSSSFHTKVQFGTLSNYFDKLRTSNITFPTFNGDFLPYSDIIFAFAPAYWTGFYGTRPFWKKLCREAEDELLKAEILFTYSYNLLNQNNHSIEKLAQNYDNLVQARRSVSLFQHHDGVTGTSPRSTMLDYARKLTQAWNFSRQIQRMSVEAIWETELNISPPPLTQDTWMQSFTSLPQQIPLRLYENVSVVKKVLVFNHLGWARSHLIRLMVETPNITVKGPNNNVILAQINPKAEYNSKLEGLYELMFIAELPPLSIVTFEILQTKSSSTVVSKLGCKNCHDKLNNYMEHNNIVLGNNKIEVSVDGNYGLLRAIRDKIKHVASNVTLSLGRYTSYRGSGAYLLSVSSTVHEILDKKTTKVLLLEGPVATELVMISKGIKLSTWICHLGSSEIQSDVHMSLEVNVEELGNGEYIMQFQSDLNNVDKSTKEKPQQIFFTDTNGLAVERRAHIHNLPYQGNHYPVVNYVFIQDTRKKQRLSILVDRTHGVSSKTAGSMELMFDRSIAYDDGRGMGEGITDVETVVSNYIVKLEALPKTHDNANYYHSWEPSLETQRASKLINHQPSLFMYDAVAGELHGSVAMISQEFPQDVFLVNLRTLSGRSASSKSVPSRISLMIMQRLGHATSKCNQSHNKQLNATIQLHHTVRQTNLVGTSSISGRNSVRVNNTKHLPVGQFYELQAFFVDL